MEFDDGGGLHLELLEGTSTGRCVIVGKDSRRSVKQGKSTHYSDGSIKGFADKGEAMNAFYTMVNRVGKGSITLGEELAASLHQIRARDHAEQLRLAEGSA
jgi:hypothetical protein